MSAVETLITAPDRALLDVPVGDIIPSPDNRQNMGDLQALAESIKDTGGPVQPLIVAPHPQHAGKWDLIAGERRLRASIMVGLDTVPCIVRRFAPVERDKTRLIENVHRKNPDPVELAAQFQLLIDRHGYTQTQIAEETGISQPVISKRLALLKLPDAVLDELRPHPDPDDGDDDEDQEDDRKLTLEEAHALLPLADHPDRILEAMHGFAPGDAYKTSVANAVRQHVQQMEHAAKRAESLEALERRKVRVIEPDHIPSSRHSVKPMTGVTPLGDGYHELKAAVGVHARHHADHHVAVVLATGEIVYGCDKPKDHEQAAKAKANGKLRGDQLHLVDEFAEAEARKQANAKAWDDATKTRRQAAAELLTKGRPTLGESILQALPGILESFQAAKLKVAARSLGLTPGSDGDPYGRQALLDHVGVDSTEGARVLLALMVATAEENATGQGARPSYWTQRPEVVTYLDWLRAGGILTDVEQRAAAGELDR